MTRVSVLIATYNGAAFIEKQLETIRGQTLPPHEVWIADDGSSDDTLKIVSRFAASAGFPVRIRVNTERAGQAENVLSAVPLCEGDVIAFCDQDDIWHPDKLKLCVEALEAEDAHLCVHAATLIDTDGSYLGYLSQGIRRREVFEPLQLSPWTIFLGMTQVFRREILSWIEPRRRGPAAESGGGELGHDGWVTFLSGSLGRVVTLAQPLASHRRPRGAHLAKTGPSYWLRARANAVKAADLLERRRAAAMHRAQLLDTFAKDRPNRPLAAQARVAALYWRRLGDIHGLRAYVYRGPTFSERRAALNRLLSLGTYRGERPEAFSNAALAKDLALGLCQLPLGPSQSQRPRMSGTRYGLRDGL